MHFMRRSPTALVVILLTFSVWTPAAAATPPPRKVAAQVWSEAVAAPVDVLVQAPGYPDLSGATLLPTREAKTHFVFETLAAHARGAQAGLIAALTARGLEHRALWISNQVWVRNATRADMLWLAARADVEVVQADRKVSGVEARSPVYRSRGPARRAVSPAGIEWGVARVRAPEVWALGDTGQGIVVADLDTGVKWDHPALIEKYRGWAGAIATHTYNWYDAAGASVGSANTAPLDDNQHGSHTTGIMIGDDGAGNQIGVAPGARWIACRNMLNNVGSVARYSTCFQFALAPTDLNGANPDPNKAADITNNSWGCYPPGIEAGCEDPGALITVTAALRAAGIMVVASAGNSGFGCGTVQSAPATLDQALSVGATGSDDAIAGFSSRGPSTLTGHVKPDLVAPGVAIRSSVLLPVNGYAALSGTSMAGPHVAGVAALLWSAAPELRGQVDESEAILRRSAQPMSSPQNCGDAAGGATPNNVFGHGMVDALAALNEAARLRAIAVGPVVSGSTNGIAGQPMSFTLTYSNPYEYKIFPNVIMTASLPPGVAYVASSSGGRISAGTVTWSGFNMAPGTHLTATLIVMPSSTGVLQLSSIGVGTAIFTRTLLPLLFH